jgi:hypothetical protein
MNIKTSNEIIDVSRYGTMKEKNTRLFCFRIIWAPSSSPLGSVGEHVPAIESGKTKREREGEVIAAVSAYGEGGEGRTQIERQVRGGPC